MLSPTEELSTPESHPVPQAPAVTPQAVRETKQQIALLQGLVKDLLRRDIDYGRIPGTPADCLWDPGAQAIIGAFNCYAGERRMISLRDDGDRLACCIEVPLVSRVTRQVMATGIGAASTMETKYKYRWMGDADLAGFDADVIATFKTRERSEATEYRIPNPEHSELLNVIVKMASKRAEVDAAESLPGVASVLRALFTNGHHSKQTPQGQKHNDGWTEFWGEARKMGYGHDEVHNILGVQSIRYDWVDKGRTLDEALEKIRIVSGER